MRDKRILGFLFIMLVASVGLIYAAVPADTLRTTAAGITTQVVDFLNSTNYYRGPTNVTGYILNADPAGDSNFSSVEADDYWLNGNINLTAWVEAGLATAGGNYTPYEYTVRCRIVGANYEAVAYDGELLYNNTSAYTCLQTSANYVTSNAAGNPVWRRGRVLNDTIILVGFGSWDIGENELALPSRVLFQGMGREATTIIGSHANNVIENMWSNVTWGTAIYDMRIEGSSSAIPIRWDMTVGTLPSGETYGWGLLDLQRLHLTDYDTYSFYWNVDAGNNAVLHINDVRAQGIWMIDRCFDSTITMFQCSELLIKDSSGTLIDHGYIGGGHQYGLRIYDGSAQNDNYQLTFTNMIIDNPTQTCVTIENYAEQIIFDNDIFSNLNWDAANNTYSAFILGGNTNHISITDCQFQNNLVYNHAGTWKYLIEEKAGSHNNTYLGNTYADNVYRGIEVWDRATGAIYEDAGNHASYWETPYGTSHGTVEASNDDWIFHYIDTSLVVDMGNLTITLTVQESDSAYAAQVKAVNATKFQLYLYDIVAGAAEEVDKTIDWTAKYEP